MSLKHPEEVIFVGPRTDIEVSFLISRVEEENFPIDRPSLWYSRSGISARADARVLARLAVLIYSFIPQPGTAMSAPKEAGKE